MTVAAEPVQDALGLPTFITLLGRKFAPSKHMTIDRDMYVMSLMRKANITKLFERKDRSPTFELDALAEEILTAAFDSGKMFEMTAAVIDEDGVKWTREGSIKLAQWLSEIEDQEAKQTLMQYIAAVILGFFVNGPAFSTTLEESLRLAAQGNLTESAGPETSAAPPSEPLPDASKEPTVEPTITVNGEPSLGSSETTTPSDIPS